MENGEPVADSAQQDAGAPAGEAVETAIVADPAAQLTAVTAERDQLAAEKADLYDRLLRRQADFENYRRRAERERSEILRFAGMETARELLPIVDDLERALKVECADQEFGKGMELIYQRLFEALKKLGLEPIPTDGRKFDPHLHYAVEVVETDEEEDHKILEEFQRGYNFRGRLLRPAMVKVAVKPQPKP